MRLDTSIARRIWIRISLDGRSRKRRPRKGGEPERAPVESPRPRPLAGGAAAELEYDD